MLRALLTAMAAAACACALPSAAPAATVTSDDTRISYTAGPREQNVLDLSRQNSPSNHYLLTDSGAPLKVGAACTALDVFSASCPWWPRRFELSLGDLDDRARAAVSGVATLRGGSGHDQLSADSYDAQTLVYGEKGNDVVSASGEGGQLADGGPGDDVVHAGGWCCNGTGLGGPGNDFVDFFVGSTIGGSATLDGGPGRDVIVVQAGRGGAVEGGDGADTIGVDSVIGSAQIISGIHLGGGLGNDSITAGAYDDTVDGGDGNDTIDVRGGGQDAVTCGAGTDSVRHDAGDTIAADCETALPE